MKKTKEELDLEMFNKGVIEGKRHSSPSPETTNFIKTMKSEMKEVKKELKDISVKIAGLPKKIIDETDKRYALKYVENEVSKIKDSKQVDLKSIIRWLFDVLIAITLLYLTIKSQ